MNNGQSHRLVYGTVRLISCEITCKFMNELSLLKKLISFDSQSFKTNKPIVDFIAGLFPKKQCRIAELKRKGNKIYNLEVRFPGKKSNKPLIFSGHTDTVPTSSRWTKNPFKAQVVGNKIYGLGSTDMKAGLACMITTALSIKEKPAQDVIFLFDADEEAGCTGGKDFVKRLKFKNAKVVVCEPTEGDLKIGQKGGLEMAVTFTGKSFHSSRTSYEKNLKFNAIQKACRAIVALGALEKGLEKKKFSLFAPPTQAICEIKGGTAGNVIPDECTFVINRRLLPTENKKAVVGQIVKVLRSIDPTVKINETFWGAPNLLDKQSELFKMAASISRKVLRKVGIKVTSGWTQAGLFNKWGDCLIWGPGILEMAHQADEYCPIDLLGKMTTCYKELIVNNK